MSLEHAVSASRVVGVTLALTASVLGCTPPGKPDAPLATEGDSRISLRWSPPVDTGGSALTGYVLEWVGGRESVGPQQNEFVVEGLINGHPYAFAVFALNAVGLGPASDPTPLVYPGTTPAAPHQVRAEAGLEHATVSWAAADGRGREVTGYTVTTSSGVTTTTSATSLVIPMEPGRYTFSVTATNVLGESMPSLPSNEVMVSTTTPAVVGRPTAVARVAAAVVRWSPPRGDGGTPQGYRVRSLPEAVEVTTGRATEAVIAGLQAGVAYKFRVSAVNDAGEGPASIATEPIMLQQGSLACTGVPFLGGAPDPVAVFEPIAVAATRLDADSALDLVVIDRTTLYLVRGRGDGTFEPPVTSLADTEFTSMAVGDLDGDSRSDVVLTRIDGGFVVFGGNGQGGVSAPHVFSGDRADAIAIARLDSDATADLAVVNRAASTVSIYLNDGGASFQPAGRLAVGDGPVSLVAADFNRDGKTDLVVPTELASLSILIGNGDGTFQPAILRSLPVSSAVSLAVGDFDADGDPDLVAVSQASAGSVLLLGNGDGTFSGASFAHLSTANFVTSLDFDHNGTVDLAALDSSSLTVLLGDGTGSFRPLFSRTFGGAAAVLEDFNDDGLIDVVTTIGSNAAIPFGGVSLMLGTPSGLPAQNTTSLGQYITQGLVVDDFNVDGQLDLALTQKVLPGRYQLKVLLGNGPGSFQAPVLSGMVGEPGEIRSGDFDRDGVPDLAIAGELGVVTFRGDGDGGLLQTASYRGNGAEPSGLTVDDFDGDGLLDLAVATAAYFGVDVYDGAPGGRFAAARRFIVGGGPRSIVSADFNRDGHADFATANELSNTVSVLFGAGDGEFGNRQDQPIGRRPVSLAAGDLNRDLVPDLVSANADSQSLSVLLGKNSGGFVRAVDIPLGTRPEDVNVGDLTLDGNTDVLVALANGRVAFLKGRGDGSLAGPIFFSAGVASALEIGHFDGDGRPDVAVLSGGGMGLLMNVCLP